MDGLSGILQHLTATATGYLDRRLDIDLERRLARATEPKLDSSQTPIQLTVPNQLFSSSTLLPLLLVGVVAVVLLKK